MTSSGLSRVDDLSRSSTVLYGISSGNINRLQRIQNTLARCVLDCKAHRSSNALLHQLHWLPIRYRIDFKLTNLAFLARLSSTRSYLNSLVARCLPSRTLRSQNANFLAVPRRKDCRDCSRLSWFSAPLFGTPSLLVLDLSTPTPPSNPI